MAEKRPSRSRDSIAPMTEERIKYENRGRSNTREVIFVRHAQRGVREGETHLTPLGRKQARETGKELRKTTGLHVEDFDYIDVRASFAGDVDPETGLPRAAETIQIITDEMGVPEAKLRPKTADAVDLSKAKNKPHYDHNARLRAFLPPNYGELNEEEKLKAEQVALAQVIDEATNDPRPEAVAYREELAGGVAFSLLIELGLMRYEESKTKSAVLIGTHSTYLEWLFKEALEWEDMNGQSHLGYQSLSEIGGPLNYAEVIRIRLMTDKDGLDATDIKERGAEKDGPKAEVVFGEHRNIRKASLNMARVIELAKAYAKLHDLPFGYNVA